MDIPKCACFENDEVRAEREGLCAAVMEGTSEMVILNMGMHHVCKEATPYVCSAAILGVATAVVALQRDEEVDINNEEVIAMLKRMVNMVEERLANVNNGETVQ